jgi:intein-encoded DNA endonuclease-like protein
MLEIFQPCGKCMKGVVIFGTVEYLLKFNIVAKQFSDVRTNAYRSLFAIVKISSSPLHPLQ